MDYLHQIVNAINEYDGSLESANKLKNLVCYISDNSDYVNDPLYRTVLFEAAQKMRMFGYIKGANKISLDEVSTGGLYDIKNQAIQNLYTSKVYSNNLLDKKQKEIVDEFMSLKKKRLLVSAPTSFGKTFLLREIIYLNQNKYNNILLVFPTIALLNENTENIKKLITDKDLNYNIVNNVYSSVDVNSRNIFILTPERTLKLLSDHETLNIDFFFFDEVYKIDDDFSTDEDTLEKASTENRKKDTGNRAKAFRIALYLLSKNVDEYYIAGPYLNLTSVKSGLQIYIETNEITIKQIDFEPTIRIEIDAWKKKAVEHHPLNGERVIKFYDNSQKLGTLEKVIDIAAYLQKNGLGQAIFYCANPSYSMRYAESIIKSLPINRKVIEKHKNFINHLKNRYGVKYRLQDREINTSDYWNFIHILSSGYGVHHGKFPKYIQKEILNMFNVGDIEYLFCTSTIIEGVNTNAKNVIIINSSVGNKPLTSFALKNIKGRAGRYYHHFVGRIFYTSKKQRDIEQQEDSKLNFSTFDKIPILDVDLDNAYIADLDNSNKERKILRDKKLNKENLPDNVFIKNRLIPRDNQEKYLEYLLEDGNFSKFKNLIGNTSNINNFIYNNMMGIILDSMADVGIIELGRKNLYSGVIHNYSSKKFRGLMEYQLERSSEPGNQIDKMYLTVFDQIRNIVEYEVPKLLCLFEAIYQQAGRIRGYNMEDFNLSVIIRFFELGVTTAFGIYLVEYGFPIDAIRDIESKLPDIKDLDVEESIMFIRKRLDQLMGILDNYEMQLLSKAVQSL